MAIKKYKMVDRNVNDLIPYVNNSRVHSDEQVIQICSSIKEFGFTNPVLIDQEDGVIAGHGRLMAAKKLGLKTVPCIVLAGLSEAQKKAYVIADNRLAEVSGWDDELLAAELQSLNELDFDMNITGFSDEDLQSLNHDLLSDTQDYSDKNKEVDGESLSDNMELKFKYSSDVYNDVRNALREYDDNLESSLLKCLGL